MSMGRITITQKDPWMTNRLLALFGGAVYKRTPEQNGCYVWAVGGSRGRGFAMTIFKFLSPRRRAQLGSLLAAKPRTQVSEATRQRMSDSQKRRYARNVTETGSKISRRPRRELVH